jgi:hypothetical protein
MRSKTLAALVAFGLLALLVPVRAGNPRGAVYSTATDQIFWFVHCSDTHIGARGSTDTNNLTWMVTTGKTAINPSFMVVTGDLTDSTNGNLFGLPNGPYQAEWDSYKNVLAGRVTASDYYDLPGNHDAYSDKYFAYYLANSVQGQATHSTQVSWTKTFPFGTYHFLGVNSCDNTGAAFSPTSPWGDHAGLDQGELDFIGARLSENAAADLTFVFGHHPVTDTGASDDTWLFYGHQPFISALDGYKASLYGYGHTHDVSDVQFAGNAYTGTMVNGGIRYENIASVAKSSSNNYDVIAVDCNGVSSVPATIGTWPVVLITAPTARRLGATVNPFAYTVPAASANPVRALVFDAGTVSSVAFKCDAETTWHPMTRVSGNTKLWQGVWNASALAAGEHTLTVQAVGTTTKSHAITVLVEASAGNRAPVAANDSFSTAQNTTLNVAAPGVLANDSDPEGNAITAALVSGPARGTLTLNADGSFIYTPASGFTGSDSFTYQASDGSLASNMATVSLTVTAAEAEVVTITMAEYKAKTKQLTVRATSSRQPNVTLTVTGYGQMTYSASAAYYSLTKKVSPAPASVTVTSSGGGSATKTVAMK